MSPAIPILIHLRDWPKAARPYNNLIALIALRDAGEKGLRAGQLSRLMGRNVSTDAATTGPPATGPSPPPARPTSPASSPFRRPARSRSELPRLP